MLLGNGANIVGMQTYDSGRGYFENTLADRMTNRKTFRSGLSIHDISRPAQPREIAFLEMPGHRHQPSVVDRRTLRLYRRASRRLHRPHPRASSTCKNTMKPEIVSRWWMPGMNRAAGENPARSRASALRCIT